MPRRTPTREIEIKLKVANLAAMETRLRRLRAQKIVPRVHESNALYDTPQSDLRRRGQLIRIRVEQPAANVGRRSTKELAAGILTYKGPARPSSSHSKAGVRSKTRSRFKIKEEAEVSFTGAVEMDRILRAMGLRPSFRYEKFRTTYALPNVPNLKIELDETPVGNYLELEGRPAGIDRAARLLGFTRDQYKRESYGALYLAECRRLGRKPGNMLFPATKKARSGAVFP
jgi:adenylate cyclase class 2